MRNSSRQDLSHLNLERVCSPRKPRLISASEPTIQIGHEQQSSCGPRRKPATVSPPSTRSASFSRGRHKFQQSTIGSQPPLQLGWLQERSARSFTGNFRCGNAAQIISNLPQLLDVFAKSLHRPPLLFELHAIRPASTFPSRKPLSNSSKCSFADINNSKAITTYWTARSPCDRSSTHPHINCCKPPEILATLS